MTTFVLNETLPVYEVTANNYAEEAENKIHNSDVAPRFGFKGGLVPGIGVHAYMTHPIVQALGREWLERGTIEVKFLKGKSPGGMQVKVTNNPDALEVRLTEEDIIDKYPWDYQILTTRLAKRFSDFKSNQKYHRLRKSLESDAKFAHQRFLNPNNPNGGKKTLYNPNILKAFDEHYKRTTE